MISKSLPYAVLILLVALLANLYPINIKNMKAIQKANQMLVDGQSSAALKEFTNLIYSFPERAYLFQKTGEAAYLAGEYELAKNYLELAKANEELDAKGLMILGDLYQQDGNWEQAINDWKQVELNQQNVTDISSRLVNVYITQSMWQEAALCLNNWLDISPDENEAHEMLGWIDLFVDPGESRKVFNDLSNETSNSYQDAIILIDKHSLAKSDPHQLSAWWVAVGDVVVDYDYPEIALKTYEKSTDIDSENANGWIKTALQKQSMGMDGKIEVTLAMKFGGNDSAVNTMLAEYWYIEKKPELSVIYLHKALEIDPKAQYNSLRLGQLLSEMGSINEGLKYVKQTAIGLNTGAGWKNVIIYCLDNGIYIQDEALPAARKAVSLEPDSSEILDLAGEVFLALEDNITAERYFEQALKKDSTNYMAHLHIGSLYVRIGSPEQAREHLFIAAQQSENLQVSEQAKKILFSIQTE